MAFKFKGPRMTRLQAWVPEDWVESIGFLVKKKGYASVSEFIRDLLRNELDRGDSHDRGENS